MKKRKITSAYMPIELRSKIEELKERDGVPVFKEYIELMTDYFLTTGVNPKNYSFDVQSIFLKFEKDFSSLRKWIGAMKRDLLDPTFSNSKLILDKLYEEKEIEVKNKPKENDIPKDNTNENKLLILNDKLKIDLEKSKEENVTIIKNVSTINNKIKNMETLISEEKGIFNKKVYIDIDKMNAFKNELETMIMNINK